MSTSTKIPDRKAAAGAFPPQRRVTPVVRETAVRGAASAGFEQAFLAPPHERIAAIKRGVPASQVNLLAERMQIPKEALISLLRLSRATVNRKARDMKPLSQDESERVLGVACLIGQVENMLRESGPGFRCRRLALGLAPRTAAGAGQPAACKLHGYGGGAEAGVDHPGDGAKRSLRLTSVIWRIAIEAPAYAANDLGGMGARLTGGRWNSIGTPMLYCSANIALATQETLSFIGSGALPFNRYLVRIEVPGPVWEMREVLSPLPAGWDAVLSGLASRKSGDGWVAGGRSPLLAVPSVIVPDEYNVLINPAHPAVAGIVATTVRRWIYDPRFF